ncbi:MAG: ferrochelatase [SAR324 cluster bacterium]|nr:ferrochelatase [SAR324 cluster bacterium]
MTDQQARPPENPAIVLLNFGGPRDLREVRVFLYEILKDPNTIQLPFPQPLQNILAWLIARRRAPEIRRQYRVIGGKSPIVQATEQIAAALQSALTAAEQPMQVFIAHRYLRGWSRQTARHITAAGVDSLLAIPLYPHFSYASSGSSFQQLDEQLRQEGFTGRVWGLRSYPAGVGYVDALAARLEECLRQGAPPPGETVILCSAHGLPEAYVKAGDPYTRELRSTLEALRPRFPQWRFVLSYQSRVGPAQWLTPYTDRILSELGAEGMRHVVFLPLSFVNDHIETLYEIGHTYFQAARDAGMAPHRVAAVEAHPAFIGELCTAATEWKSSRGGLPLAELLPPSQHFARVGRWAWVLWLVALAAALLHALL